jgi:hypothetical protein
MNLMKLKTARLGGLLALVLGAAALLALPGVAAAKDHNHDGIPDGWEKSHHLSLQVNQAHRDQDRDQLTNRAEFLAGDNPRDDDSNNDGVMDGEENAGTIASFDAATGKLTISLFGGETLSGVVTESTEIKCEGVDNSSGDRQLSDSGSSSGQSGDDNGGHDEEPGDDNGGDNSGPGSSSSGPGNGDEQGENGECTTAALVPGAVVQEAELNASQGVATFEKVELSHTS